MKKCHTRATPPATRLSGHGSAQHRPLADTCGTGQPQQTIPNVTKSELKGKRTLQHHRSARGAPTRAHCHPC
eukprot:CAMPEP_0204266612 /NCGR_PEP_ID=MMETSP0468-20130131/10433_1 /ASSEMBLY_ACC=CAM_ASM_000383 /TAXON_ID=2969 /ORGANISM="Oxyrrhis marina" /LENGTH=71 /DNA_ID=CAMNT_0051241695 /DNA_START=46 /DNA_END=261 /DNA_ORIENTATION=+